MQTLKVNILGNYYDSKIYSSKLYLWTEDNSIITIDWRELTKNIISSMPNHLKFAAQCALEDNAILYTYHFNLFNLDLEARQLLVSRFEQLNSFSFELTKEDIKTFIIKEQDNPFYFPHADVIFFHNKLYVGGKSGLESSSVGGNTNPITKKIQKLWDGTILSIDGSQKTLALAAGNEGVYEYNINEENNLILPRLNQPSSMVRWLYPSFCSTSYGQSFFANYNYEKLLQEDQNEQFERVLKELISVNDIFEIPFSDSQIAWGAKDKICLANRDAIYVKKYSPPTKSNNSDRSTVKQLEHITELGNMLIDHIEGEIISSDAALFGYIIEDEDGLTVFTETGSLRFEGEPVNWRVFPNSRYYTNHLHIIYEDHLAIHSFNNDYLYNQETKMMGISF